MNLDKLTVEIRPRRPWEAVDLGALMARRWWLQLMTILFVVTFPFFLALSFLPLDWLWLQLCILWWLKPLFERPLLFVLSQTVFGQYPSTAEAVRAFPALAKKQSVMSLLWRRFSPNRSVDLSVLQLEGLSGTDRSMRLAVLHRDGTSPAVALSFFGLCLEMVLAVALASFVFMFIPQEFNVNWQQVYFDQSSRFTILITHLLFYLSALCVAPFYVAMGFALYLNRRVHLEGWDIEIAFRRIASKREQAAHKTPSLGAVNSNIVASLVLVVMATLLGGAEDASAQQALADQSEVIAEREALEDYPSIPTEDISHLNLNTDNARRLIEDIKHGDEFNRRASSKTIDMSSWWADDEPEDTSQWNFDWLSSIFASMKWFAGAGEIIFWVIVLGVVAIIIFKYRVWLAEFVGHSIAVSPRSAPRVLFGLEVTQESLPDDVSAKASQHWARNERREALSLLYRACLFQLIDRGVELRDGDTEGRCLAKGLTHAQHAEFPAEALAYFDSLTQSWQRFAYGHIEPDNDVGLTLCRQWNVVWQVRLHGVPDA